MSIERAVEQLHTEHTNRETVIMQHGVESRTWWQLLLHKMFRKLSIEYRARRRVYIEKWDEQYELEDGLPYALRTALMNTERNVSDLRWFQVMEKPRLLVLMLCAARLCEVFRLSVFTAADRRTLFWVQDHGTIARAFGYMLDEVSESAALRVRGFPFHDFALAELREIAVFLDMMIETEN